MDNTLPVATGSFWWDRSQSELSQTSSRPRRLALTNVADWFTGILITMGDNAFKILNLVVGVLFGLAQPSFERILTHLIAGIGYLWTKLHRAEVDQHPERGGLIVASLPQEKTERNWFQSLYDWIFTKANAVKATSLVLLVIAAAYMIAGAFATQFPVEQAALSASKRCSAWDLRNDAKAAAQDDDALIQGEREARAGQNARECYGARLETSLENCSKFKEQNIGTLEMKKEQQCPFMNETFCPGSGFTAVKFTTGLVDAKTIGINAYNAPKFNRTMICVPLDLDAGFAEDLGNGTRKGEWGYNLGPVSSDEYQSNYTFRQYGDPFTYDVRSYTLRSVMFSTCWDIY